MGRGPFRPAAIWIAIAGHHIAATPVAGSQDNRQKSIAREHELAMTHVQRCVHARPPHSLHPY
jgi:hypothetical protein